MVPKSEVRARSKALRAAMKPELRATYDARIVARCQAELDWAHYRRAMLFAPITRQHEINTWPLINWLFASCPALEIYLPRVRGDELEAVKVTARTEYELSDLGVPEPRFGPVLDDYEPMDIILTPLLGFDAGGSRVGYGGGYYDRFLARQPRAFKVGLGYAGQFVAGGIVAEAHDVRVDRVITE